MHGDMVRALPPGAAWLASSDMYPHQAFRVGTSAWGVQFHPEVSLASYREWVSAYPGEEPDALDRKRRGLADFERLEDDVVSATRSLAGRFAMMVRETAGARRASTPHAATRG
jgi:GMP synthase (glutamine-hydrolysing)